MISIPASLEELARVFRQHGRQCYLVGGAIRDMLLGRPSTDYDIATDALPQEVQGMFQRVIPTGPEARHRHRAVPGLALRGDHLPHRPRVPGRPAPGFGGVHSLHRGGPAPPGFHRQRHRLRPGLPPPAGPARRAGATCTAASSAPSATRWSAFARTACAPCAPAASPPNSASAWSRPPSPPSRPAWTPCARCPASASARSWCAC